MFNKSKALFVGLLLLLGCGSAGDTESVPGMPNYELSLNLTTANINNDNNVGSAISIAVDDMDNPNVCHKSNGTPGVIKLETKPAVWSSQDIVPETATGITSLVIDSSDKIHIVYSSSSNAYYITNKSGSWVSSNFDSDNLLSKSYASISIDDTDKLHISYYDITNSSLKYTTNISGSWASSTIDNNDDIGKYSSIKLDSNNNVHIVYLSSTAKSIKHITNKSGAWLTETVVDGVGNNYTIFEERYFSFHLDSIDNIHLSYFDYSNKDLKYATNTGASWQVQTIDSYGSVGRYNKIAIDSSDKVHICYYEQNNGFLKYATNKNGSWQFAKIDDTSESFSNTGFGNDMVIDSNDNVHLAYRLYFEDGVTNYKNLKYAKVSFSE